MTQQEKFDLESVYDEQIAPLMAQIIAICKEHKLPMFSTFLFAHDPQNEDESYCTSSLMFEERPIPPKMLELRKIVYRQRKPILHMTVKNAAGEVIEDSVIIP